MGAVDKAPDAFRTISEVADELNVPQHVLRFWESRFRDIKPMKRGGGRRYYRPDDVDLLRGIRHLLYGEGYTIRGVQRILREQSVKFVQAVWQPGAPQPSHGRAENGDDAESDEIELPRHGVPEETERRRGLFGLLPALLGDDAGDRMARPPAGDLRQEPRALPPPAGLATALPHALPRDDVRRLRAALHELGECRKLIDAALNERA
jgi:DNA-binding transcriptional MerR regulator